ncbi:STAS domain-containing protein [Streptomyces roseicoloratus]|uniref:STAS domain-containing protein n=1 Tax=Streptomyces roseicoloratus TaxID=2508722 RepID=A0ABY9RQ67_9ACTN|nr:STAS domain-containing protein [Streptomyces roseicoloratus]WMX44347.1 STAS domain-containing protein [Streptomyces roseicoloratus]
MVPVGSVPPQGSGARPALTESRTYRAPAGTAWVVREPSPAPGTVVLSAAGEFDVDTVDCLRQALAEARLLEARQTVLDISRIGFGDSSFLHELVIAHFTGGRFVLAGPVPRRLHQLFMMTGTLRLFRIVKDRAVLGFA